MKYMLKFVVAGAVFLTGLNVFANVSGVSAKFLRIDLTRHFSDHSFNLLGDGRSAEFQGIEIFFQADNGYEIEIVKNEQTPGTVECPAPDRIDEGSLHMLHVAPATEYDDGSSCLYRVKLEDGRTAAVEFFSAGT